MNQKQRQKAEKEHRNWILREMIHHEWYKTETIAYATCETTSKTRRILQKMEADGEVVSYKIVMYSGSSRHRLQWRLA